MSAIEAILYRAASSTPAVRWSADEAQLRQCQLVLTHVWDIDVAVSVDLEATDVPALSGPATCRARPPQSRHDGVPPAVVVLSRSDLKHREARSNTVHPRSPVVIVPDGERTRYQRIVVGIHPSTAARSALVWARQEARLRNCAVEAVNAWQLQPRSARMALRTTLHPDNAIAAFQPYVEDRIGSWIGGSQDPPEIGTRAEHGGPLDVLLAAAEDADMIVVGHRGHAGLARAWSCHVARDLARLAPCAVAIVPAAASASAARRR
jgi:nucleotide-binding universal stress UspA family protein